MKPNEIGAQERRLAAALFEQAPCRAFRIEPPGSAVERWVEVCPGPAGQGLLRHWLTKVAQRQLRAVGIADLGDRVWTLALSFGEQGWASYTVRAMGVSSWSGALFPLPDPLKVWPEGVILSPDETRLALDIETDLLGIVLPVNGWTVLGFVFNEYSEYELGQLAAKLLDGTYAIADYLHKPCKIVGLPQPELTLEFPATAPLDKVQIIPAQPHIQLNPTQENESRLFKEHWILRLLNPPEKDERHE